MAFIHTTIGFANTAGVTGMAADKLVNRMFYSCADIGTGFPGWYQYQSDSADTLASPYVIDCTNGDGRFILFTNSNVTIRTSTPEGSVTVRFAGQMVLDTTNLRLWIADAANIGTTSWDYYAVVLTP